MSAIWTIPLGILLVELFKRRNSFDYESLEEEPRSRTESVAAVVLSTLLFLSHLGSGNGYVATAEFLEVLFGMVIGFYFI